MGDEQTEKKVIQNYHLEIGTVSQPREKGDTNLQDEESGHTIVG